MDGFKDVISPLTALVGLISVLIPLFGYLADKKRSANALAEGRSEVLLIRPGPPWSFNRRLELCSPSSENVREELAVEPLQE
jgi:hypothetical protein